MNVLFLLEAFFPEPSSLLTGFEPSALETQSLSRDLCSHYIPGSGVQFQFLVIVYVIVFLGSLFCLAGDIPLGVSSRVGLWRVNSLVCVCVDLSLCPDWWVGWTTPAR